MPTLPKAQPPTTSGDRCMGTGPVPWFPPSPCTPLRKYVGNYALVKLWAYLRQTAHLPPAQEGQAHETAWLEGGRVRVKHKCTHRVATFSPSFAFHFFFCSDRLKTTSPVFWTVCVACHFFPFCLFFLKKTMKKLLT